MNQTQKKYAITRITAILDKKFTEVSRKDAALLEKWREESKPNPSDVVDAILSGKAKPIKNPADLSLESLFDLSKLTKAAKNITKTMGKLETTVHLERLEQDRTSYRATANFNFISTVESIKAIQAAHGEACDQIMLGSDEEALAAIAAIEARTF